MSNRAERLQYVFAALALLMFLGSAFLPHPVEAAARQARATAQNASANGTAAASANRVLVLPFQVYAPKEREKTEAEFPEMLGRRIGLGGAAVVPHEQMLQLIQSRKVSTLDVATVRSLAAAAGATHAVYGGINQAGTTLSIDARLVSANAALPPQPVYVEQSAGNANLGYAVDELAAAVVNGLPKAAAPAMRAGDDALLAGVEVRGTKVLDPDVVLMRLSTRKGDRPDPAVIDQEVKQIWDLGYFTDVKVDLQQRPGGLFLVYTVQEKPRIEAITFEGNDELDDEDILAVMSAKSGSILNESLLADDIQKIIELYRKDGYYLVRVESRTEPRQDGSSATLVLTIQEGQKLYIKNVRIEGVSPEYEDDLKGDLMLSERGMFSWITGSGVLKEELVERDSSAINAFYLERGHVDITVAAAKIDYADDGITVTFPVHEGPAYTLGGISFSGDLIDTDERLRLVTVTDDLAVANEPFKLSAMQDDTKKLTDFYSDYGYAFADVNPRLNKRQDGSSVVDIDYVIQRKNKVYVRQVLAEGNYKTRDNVILREMRLTDGEQFEGDKLRRSTERLDKLGYFEVAEAELVPTSQPDEVDLKIKIKEKPTGAVMAGFGYSTFSNFGVAGTIMERNLWGKGYNVSLQAAFSGRRDAYTFSFTNPRLNDTPLTVGVDLYHWRDDYIDYIKRTTGGVLRFGYPIGEYSSIGWGYRLDRYKIYDLNEDAASIIRKYAYDDRYTSVGLARIMRDSTNREHPTSGNRDMLSLEYGGGFFGGDDDFVTVSAEHDSYYQLWANHVLHGRVKGAAIFRNGSEEVPVFERFWMGGMNSVRGYDSRDIVPRDPATGDRIGGDRMAFANLEYIWTMNNDVGLYLVPFFDVGFNLDTGHDYTMSDEIKRSTGLELRWRSPMGDLRFSYGIPFDEDRKGDRDAGRFEFSMGQMF